MLMFWFCVALAQCGLLWLLARCGRSLVRKAGEERRRTVSRLRAAGPGRR